MPRWDRAVTATQARYLEVYDARLRARSTSEIVRLDRNLARLLDLMHVEAGLPPIPSKRSS